VEKKLLLNVAVVLRPRPLAITEEQAQNRPPPLPPVAVRRRRSEDDFDKAAMIIVGEEKEKVRREMNVLIYSQSISSLWMIVIMQCNNANYTRSRRMKQQDKV